MARYESVGVIPARLPAKRLFMSQYRNSGSMFSSSERSRPAATRKRPVFVLPVRPAQAEPESGSKSLAVDFAL